MSEHAEPMTPRQLWVVFGLVGLIAGATSVYFGYAAWAFAVTIVAISLVFAPRTAAAGGAFAGIGVGAGAMLWLASSCPRATECEPRFAIEPFVALAALALVAGLGLSLLFVSRHVVRRTG